MYLVKATPKWRNNLLPIPISGENAIKYPVNPPHMISVPENTAKYLVSKRLAFVCDYKGNQIEASFSPATSKAVSASPEKTEKKKPEVEEEPVNLDEFQDAAVEFVSTKSKREISRVKWIAAETADALKAIEDLDWEKIAESLDSRQAESLLKHLAKKSKS